MAQITDGNNTSGYANVDDYYALTINPQSTKSNAGFISITNNRDAGLVTGKFFNKSSEVSPDLKFRIALNTIAYSLNFESTVHSRAHVSITAATMSFSQSNNYLTLNSADTTTANTSVVMRTWRTFPLFGSFSTELHIIAKEVNTGATNVISEWGLGYATTTSAPTDGIFFRRLSGGILRAVLVYNSIEKVQEIDITNIPPRDGAGVFSATEWTHYKIMTNNDQVFFIINGVIVANFDAPAFSPIPTSSQEQPVTARVYIPTGQTASSGRRLDVAYFEVTSEDIASYKLYSHQMAGIGAIFYQTQAGTTSGQTANYTNSAAPSSASLSNTTAGYATLGGQYQFAATATNETDWALFAYTNPAGTSSLPAKTLYVTGIRIGEMTVTGAAVVNPTTFFWAAGISSTAVDLTTADGNATLSARRVPLGCQGFVATAAVGVQSSGFFVDFSQAPLVVPANTNMHVILKQLNGAATASLVFRGTVTITGYFE